MKRASQSASAAYAELTLVTVKLASRATRYQRAPIELAVSAQYLRHHLALVGRIAPRFAKDAIARLQKSQLGPCRVP